MTTLVKSRLTNRRRPSDIARTARETSAPRAKAIVLSPSIFATEQRSSLAYTQCLRWHEPATRLMVARVLVKGAIFNQRVTLLHLSRSLAPSPPGEFLGLALLHLMTEAGHAVSIPALKELQIQAETMSQNVVQEHLEGLLLDSCQGDLPPRAVSELLLIAHDDLHEKCLLMLTEAGFDTHLGVFHTGEEALASDLAMVFRSMIADAAVQRLLQLRQITSRDLDLEGGCCQLTQKGREKVRRAVDDQLRSSAPSALPGDRPSYANVLKDQVADLAAYLRGEVELLRIYLCVG